MKISNSKKELARTISENGGWKAKKAGWSAQDGSDGQVSFFKIEAPTYSKPQKEWMAFGDSVHCYDSRIEGCKVIKNFHQTILSREEYFHLYPEHTETEYKDGVKPTDTAKADDPSKPTIEQLAADYRNKLDYANRKQDEADKANMESDAALAQLEDAIAEIGFSITPLGAPEKEPEMVISAQVGDQVECVESNIKRDKYNGTVGRLHFIDESDTSTPYLVDFGGEAKIWCHKVKVIRRP